MSEHGSSDHKSVASSSSEEEDYTVEDLLAAKDIEKLTGSKLDIKLLEINTGTMRKFVHTPKEAVRVPFDTVPYLDCL